MSGVADELYIDNHNVVVQPSAPIEEEVNTTATTTLVESNETTSSTSLLSSVPLSATIPTLQLSVSGAPGAAAKHGINGTNGSDTHTGQQGQDGTDATPPQPGQSAGHIVLHLSSSTTATGTSSSLGSTVSNKSCNPIILAQYSMTTTSTTAEADLLEQSAFLLPQFVQDSGNAGVPPPSLSSSVVQVSAVGGNGGNGGIGGNGGNGDRGHHGRGATRFSNATNGGPGGDGGDAGRGSAGANGGAGGAIDIHVTDADSYLLMLVDACTAPECLVVGGRGGKQGRHGTPGQGGPGGYGGSGCTYHDGEHLHHKPGGWPGPDGRTGREANSELYDGENGRPGVFRIHIVTSSGGSVIKSYPKRYDVICRHVELSSTLALPVGNNVFQFTDTVDVASFVVENIGPMPTPIEPIQCFILPDDSILLLDDDSNRANIQNRLAPAAAPTTICDRMSFQIKAPDIRTMDVNMEPYCLSKVLHLGAQQLGPAGFACGYDNFHKDGVAVEFRFPVQNTKGIVGLSSIEAGDTQKISFEIENISNEDLGAHSSSQRHLYVQFYINSDPQYNVASEHFTLSINGTECKSLKLDDSESLLRGTSFPIDLVSAKGCVTLEGLLTFSHQVAPYSQLGLQAEILLQDLPASSPGTTAESTLSPVQRRQLVIASEPTYCPSSSYKAILVTSASTTRAQFNAWRDILTTRLGLSVGYYSVSIYGNLSPDFQLSNGATLRAEFSNKLVIVLDETFRPVCEGSRDMAPSLMLPHGGMAQSSGFDRSTQWLFVASSEESVEHLSACHFTVPPNDVRSYDNVSEYFEAKKASLEKERLQGAITDLEILEEKIRVPASSGDLPRVAKRVAKWLEKRDILRQYIIKSERDLVTTSEGTVLGWIFVRRGYCRTANTVRVIQRVESHETSRVLDDTSILFSTILSCPVSTQISSYCHAVRAGQTDIEQCIRNVFVHSCLWDLSNFIKGQLDPKGAQFGDSFPTLSALLSSEEIETLARDAPPKSQSGASTDMIVNSISALVAGLYWIAHSKDLRPWWCPWSSKHAIRQTLSDLVDQISTKWGHAIQDIVVDNEKDKLEEAVTMYIQQTYCLPMPRWFRRFQRGLLHIVTPHEPGGGLSRGVAIRLIEHDGRKKANLTKDISVRPPKEVINNSRYRTLQDEAEQQQRQSIELYMAIQATRAKATIKTEMDVQL